MLNKCDLRSSAHNFWQEALLWLLAGLQRKLSHVGDFVLHCTLLFPSGDSAVLANATSTPASHQLIPQSP